MKTCVHVRLDGIVDCVRSPEEAHNRDVEEVECGVSACALSESVKIATCSGITRCPKKGSTGYIGLSRAQEIVRRSKAPRRTLDQTNNRTRITFIRSNH